MSKHGANAYLAQKLLREGGDLPLLPLSDIEAFELGNILRADAEKYYQAGFVTYMDALGGLRQKTWSWSAVKFYYSVFYLARSLLALEGIAYVSVVNKLGWMKSQAGAQLQSLPKHKSKSPGQGAEKKRLTGSHGAVLYLLELNYPTSRLLSQEIDGLYPTEWMMREREKHNYHNCGFPDPHPPEVFSSVSSAGMALGDLLAVYYKDEDFLYTFSPEHAIIAYPTFVIKHVASRLNNSPLTLESVQNAHFGDEPLSMGYSDMPISAALDFAKNLFRNDGERLDFLVDLVR